MSLKQTILDVSELEAPYPLMKASAAAKDLKDDEEILFKHRIFPCKLPDILDNLHCKYEILKDEENDFEMKITKVSDK